ncbi:uncharacterized protein LOC132805414 [Ziziphus jujuba]|uniref:Uncharacterized protein LOC132805414 n=1 Tax=Ziziphus jujuba TaxID=326968 RepID=A0ABM4AHW6_ZIZJJ|nr:uncharacterized protein LOC132805414 [Ziziphus jujuba]
MSFIISFTNSKTSPKSLHSRALSLFLSLFKKKKKKVSKGEKEKKKKKFRNGKSEIQMEECMKESMRKLALWHTRTFKPIMTHDELEPIMATLGFVGKLPPPPSSSGVWKEYVYSAGGWRFQFAKCGSVSGSGSDPPPPKPKLPYPRIDGLHIYTYRAFIDAVSFYIGMDDISDLFHIRGMPLYRIHDRNRKWRRMEEDESVFVFRDGTLEQATYNRYRFDHKNSSNNGSNGYKSNMLRNQGNNATTQTSCNIVALKDIIL